MSTDAVNTVSVDIAGTEISLETGKLAKQAGGAVVVRQGDTVVLCTATVGNLRDVDFLPLTVDVEERMYAAGKIPGSFFKREGRSGEKGTLTARMIDRPIRPLFPKGWHFETQLVAMPLSVDHVHPYDILAMNGASAALMISEVPLPTPVGAVRVGKIDGNFVVNPTEESLLDGVEGGSDLDLIVAGTEEAILMVEAGANEIPEAEILDALDIAHDAIKKLCQAQRDLAAKAGKEKLQVERAADRRGADRADPRLARRRARRRDAGRRQARAPGRDEGRRGGGRRAVRRRPRPPTTTPSARAAALAAFAKLEKAIDPQPHRRPEEAPRRALGERDPPDHDRGRPAAARVTARRSSRAARRRRCRSSRSARSRRRCGSTRSASRRTATTGTTTTSRPSRSARPASCAAPSAATSATARSPSGRSCRSCRRTEEFPYTIRIVSDILESNGSSSMASVCGSSLSLMDAGVPIKAPVAGIAMGLIKEGDDYTVLTDIAGVEDHLGDMDFKVAGTAAGITALQMDIKITGVTFEILRDALAQAREARMDILGQMATVIAAPRAELSPHAPRIIQIQIDPSQIGLLIGKGGETIRGLSDEFESQIDVNDEGQVLIYSSNGELGEALAERIRSMMKEVEVGDEFTGKVVKTTTFGAFVELTQGHRRPAAHLQRLARPARQHGRGGPQPRRRDPGQGRRGRPRARPHRPAPLGRPVDRRQVERGARGGRRLGRRPRRPRRSRPAPGPQRPRRPRRRAWRARLRPPASPARGQRPRPLRYARSAA